MTPTLVVPCERGRDPGPLTSVKPASDERATRQPYRRGQSRGRSKEPARVFNNSEEVLKYISDEKVEYIDIRFCDLPGVMQHLTVPAVTAAGLLEDGAAFDGSSVRGFQAINESDMALLADSATAVLDPFRKHQTLNINFFVHDPMTGEPDSRDPGTAARKAEEYGEGSGVADTASVAPEAEFYIFDSSRFGSDPHETFHHIGSVEGWWNTGRDEPG